jgi:RHS repeat-associated protein
LHGDEFDQTFARVDLRAANASERVQWYLTDHLNSVRLVLDETGAVLDQIAYDAFGNIVAQLNPLLANPILFASREFDAETGLYYNRARYLDPSTGRWTTQDPMGFAAGDANLYRYVFNNPVVYTDPSGLWSWQNFWIGVGVATTVVASGIFIVGTGGLGTPVVIGIATVGIGATGVASGYFAGSPGQAAAIGAGGGVATLCAIWLAPLLISVAPPSVGTPEAWVAAQTAAGWSAGQMLQYARAMWNLAVRLDNIAEVRFWAQVIRLLGH